MNNVDRAVRGYTRTLERIAEQHTTTLAAAERRASDSWAAADEKLIAAKHVYERAVERAKASLHETRGLADAARAEAEQRAVEEFDGEMRRIVGAPSGSRLAQYGSRLVLDLGDGRQPIASAERVGSGAWQVSGGEGPVAIFGDAVTARRALWERCRPTVTTAHAQAV